MISWFLLAFLLSHACATEAAAAGFGDGDDGHDGGGGHGDGDGPSNYNPYVQWWGSLNQAFGDGDGPNNFNSYYPFNQGWGHVHEEPVDGQWGEWQRWCHCSVTEGAGYRWRQRFCSNPAPSCEGEDCNQCDGVEVRECFVVPPPVDGGWGEWGPWDYCSATCGPATHTRSRNCDHPEPRCGGAACPGLAEETEDCEILIGCDGW